MVIGWTRTECTMHAGVLPALWIAGRDGCPLACMHACMLERDRDRDACLDGIMICLMGQGQGCVLGQNHDLSHTCLLGWDAFLEGKRGVCAQEGSYRNAWCLGSRFLARMRIRAFQDFWFLEECLLPRIMAPCILKECSRVMIPCRNARLLGSCVRVALIARPSLHCACAEPHTFCSYCAGGRGQCVQPEESIKECLMHSEMQAQQTLAKWDFGQKQELANLGPDMHKKEHTLHNAL
eukprot:1162019-Pelagomonas_calceolata.AAC.1